MFANLHWPTHNVWVTRAKVAKDATCRFLSLLTSQVKQQDIRSRATSGQRLSVWACTRGSETVCGVTAIPMHQGSDSSATQGGALCTPGCPLHTLVWDSPNAMLFALNTVMSCQILLKWSLKNENKKNLTKKQSLLRKLWLVCTNFTVKVYGEGFLCMIPKHFCEVCIDGWMTESECMKKYITALFERLLSIRTKLASAAVSQILSLELACERYWHLLLSRIANMPKRLNLLCRYHLRREVSNMRNCVSEKGLYSVFVQGWRVCMFGLNLLK